MSNTVRIADLMETSGVGFGTSGARGLVAAMTDAVCFAYAAGVPRLPGGPGRRRRPGRVAIAGDLRPEHRAHPRALRVAHRARRRNVVVNCGRVPTPALALFGDWRSGSRA